MTATGGTATGGDGWHDNGKGQKGDRRHDDGDGRHNDGKGQQGDRWHGNGDGRHDDNDWRHGDGRHNDGKGQKEAAVPPPPAYQPQHHREIVYKSRQRI